jgi:hypothetical protein
VIEDIIETLNWLTITIPFIAAGSLYAWFEAKKTHKTISVPLAILALLGLWFLLFAMYQQVGFPFWMRWPSQLLGYPYITR